VAERAYTDAEIEAAIAALSDAERLRAAQELVTRAAPQLGHVLAQALGARVRKTAVPEIGWIDVETTDRNN